MRLMKQLGIIFGGLICILLATAVIVSSIVLIVCGYKELVIIGSSVIIACVSGLILLGIGLIIFYRGINYKKRETNDKGKDI